MPILPSVKLLDPPSVETRPEHDFTKAITSALPVDAKPAGRQVGPTVTRYSFTLPIGTDPAKVAKSEGVLTLATSRPVRYVGVQEGRVVFEVPNEHRRTVRLREVIERGHALVSLGIAVGLDAAGEPVVTMLSRLPHLLVAGATGQGKSVAVNSILAALLMRCTPADLQLLMIDPKEVEFSAYRHLPHLYSPIVTDMQDAADSLDQMVELMDQRYSQMRDAGVKDLDGWNNTESTKWSRVVVVIDELADLMMTHKKKVEPLIVRLAQKGRAAGIHLIVATQYPKADVVTPLIKQNVPSRLALTVSDHVASNLILGRSGAERLTGQGDALWSPVGELEPTRVQTPFVSDAELDRLLAWWVQRDEAARADAEHRARIAAGVEAANAARLADMAAAEAAERDEMTQEAREVLEGADVAAREATTASSDVDPVAAVVAAALAMRERWDSDRVHQERRIAVLEAEQRRSLANIEGMLTQMLGGQGR